MPVVPSSRTVVVPANPQSINNLYQRFPNQQPASTLLYAIDVHNAVDFTDSLVSFTVSPSPTDLTVTTVAPLSAGLLTYPDNCVAYFNVSGGSNDTIYDLAFSFTFASGQTFDCSAYILIAPVGTQLSNLVVNETTRANAAETVLSNAISTETARAEYAEQAAFRAITAEQYRAQAAEVALGSLVIGANGVLQTTGVSPGTYSSVTVDSYGRVVSASSSFAYPLAGYAGLDPAQASNATSVNLSVTQARSKNRLPVSLWENSTVANTVNLYLTQNAVDAANAAFAANGQTQAATLDNGKIINYALGHSSRTGYGYHLPFGTYNHSIAYQFQGNEDIEFEQGACLVSTWDTSGSSQQFTCNTATTSGRVSGVKLTNFWLHKKHTVYTDWFSGVITTDVNNWRTVGSGDWTGITNFTPSGWQTSPENLFIKASSTRYYDYLPSGLTLAQLNASGPPWTKKTVFAAGGTCVSNGNLYSTATGGTSGNASAPSGTSPGTDGTITNWTYVSAGSPVYVHNNQFLNYGSVVVGASYQNTTLADGITPWSGYVVVLQPASGINYANAAKSPGSIPATPDQGATTANPSINAIPYIPAPTDYYLSAPPQFYTGGLMSMVCDDLVMQGCRLTGGSQGRSLTLLGNDVRIDRLFIGLVDGNSGAAGIRAVGGVNWSVTNSVIRSGDDALQNVCFSTYNAVTGFGPTANQNSRFRYINNEGTSYSGRAAIISLTGVAPFNQQTVYLGNANTISNTNTITFPPGVFQNSSVTITQLLTSYPEWAASTSYAVGIIRSNNALLYVCTNAGISSGDQGMTGPTGTGTGITDGSVVWNYLSAGSPVYVGAKAQAIYAGTYVSNAVVNANTSVSVTMTPPPGQTQVVHSFIRANSAIYFSVGQPIGTGTNSAYGIYANNYLRSCNVTCVDVDNTTSSGLAEIELVDNIVDCSYCFVTVGNPGGSINLDGGALGNVKAVIRGNKIIQPYQSALTTNGNIVGLYIEGNNFDGSRNPNGSNVQFYAAQSGSFKDNVVWSSPGVNVMKLGSTNGTDGYGNVVNNGAANIEVRGNSFCGINDGYFGLTRGNSTDDTITNNRFVQATALGAGNGLGINFGGGSTIGFLERNDYTGIDGNPYTVASGGAMPPIGLNGERYNSAPFQTFSLPAPVVIPAYASGTFTPSYSCGGNVDVVLSNVVSVGNYVVIGGVVQISFSLTCTVAYANSTGAVYITGLPFQANTVSTPCAIQPTTGSAIGKYHSGGTSYQYFASKATSRLQIALFASNSSSTLQSITDNPSGTTFVYSGSGIYNT